jgi:hypothetical protein
MITTTVNVKSNLPFHFYFLSFYTLFTSAVNSADFFLRIRRLLSISAITREYSDFAGLIS